MDTLDRFQHTLLLLSAKVGSASDTATAKARLYRINSWDKFPDSYCKFDRHYIFFRSDRRKTWAALSYRYCLHHFLGADTAITPVKPYGCSFREPSYGHSGQAVNRRSCSAWWAVREPENSRSFVCRQFSTTDFPMTRKS